MTETDPLLAIERAVTEGGGKDKFLNYVQDHWPRLVGAHIADVLEHTTSYDMFLDITEPFYESYGDQLPATYAARAALHALIILGGELTVTRLAHLLAKAGLIRQPPVPPLDWRMVIRGPGAVAGYQAEHGDWHYLTMRSDRSAYLLTRWTRGHAPNSLDAMMQACREVAAVTTPDEGRRLAELFAAGEDIPEIGWFHTPPPALVTS